MLASIFGIGLLLDIASVAVRLVIIISVAAGIAWLARLNPTATGKVLPSAQAAAGIAVIGLMMVGLAAASAIRSYWMIDSQHFQQLLVAAFLANVVACATGAIVFAWLGMEAALTVGLLSGNRNVTLVWAAAGGSLPLEAEPFVAASVVPILSLPLALKAGLACGKAFSKWFSIRPKRSSSSRL